jgi:Domain of unknown function (DUF2019)
MMDDRWKSVSDEALVSQFAAAGDQYAAARSRATADSLNVLMGDLGRDFMARGVTAQRMLLPLLGHPHPQVRFAAARACEAIEPARCYDVMKDASGVARPPGKFSIEAFVYLLDTSEEFRKDVEKVYGKPAGELDPVKPPE